MSTNPIRGLTTIIVPCWNQIAFTQQCIASLKSHTRPPWELIVIDNGSTDPTPTYLAGVHDMAAVPVTVVTNTRNLGFPAAINQGLRLAHGEYLVLLNNDVVVTDGWLDQLIALVNAKRSSVVSGQLSVVGEGEQTGRSTAKDAQEGAEIGLVGPMSNYAAPPQLVDDVPYRDLEEMHAFAKRWRDERRKQWFTVPKLSGFCLLMKRAVYDKIGGLDERFGLGLFDDDDLAERARRAGFELAVAHDLFVHHFGSRTFVGNGVDAGKLLDENARRFADKWGLKEPNGKPVALRPWQGGGSGAPAGSKLAADQRRETSHPVTRRVNESARETAGEPPVMNDASLTRSASEGPSITASAAPHTNPKRQRGSLSTTASAAPKRQRERSRFACGVASFSC